jgi:hypothetical protein
VAPAAKLGGLIQRLTARNALREGEPDMFLTRSTLLSIVIMAAVAGCSQNAGPAPSDSLAQAAKSDDGCPNENDFLIQRLADNAGPLVQPSPEFAAYVTDTVVEKLPAEIQELANSLVEDRTEWRPEDREDADGNVHVEWVLYNDPSLGSCYLIVNAQGDQIGYIITLLDNIDNSYWDGSGAAYYMNLQGTIIDDPEWQG